MQIEDSYAVSPVQHGMLIHSLCAPQSGVYIQQLIGVLREELNVSAFQRAWEQILSRHAILRTSFSWEGLDEPLQRLHRDVRLPFDYQDWSHLSSDRQAELLEDFLQSDRRQGFHLDETPLIRLTLFRCAQAEYRWIWTSHHALFDGRSRLLLLKELFGLYEAFCRGRNLRWTRPVPYREYIDWLGKKDFAGAERFWRSILNGFIAPTPLAVERGQPTATAIQSFGKQTTRLSESVTSALRSLAEQHQLTPNTFLQGAWALLLSRYSGEGDVVFGATRAGRHAAVRAVESIVGLLINTVPVRVSISSESLLLPWLNELRNQWIAMRDFEHTPLGKIQQWSQIPAGKPLFESLLVFENYQLNAALREQGEEWDKREFELLETTNYPLTVVGNLGRELSLEVTFDRHRFDDAIMARVLGHLRTLLEQMVSDPTRRLSEMPMLTESERHQLLVEWNRTKRDYPQDKCIHELFEEQVERTPDAVAVVFEDHQLTYRELNRRANQLAHYLQKRGVGPDTLVAVCMERSLEMVIGLLGILKAGGAYVPLDATYPPDRLSFMLQDAQPPLLLTQAHLIDRSSEHAAKVICLDTDRSGVAQEEIEKPFSGAVPGNLAYVIYTSGSTGLPKGAMNTHRGVCNRLHWMQEAYQLTPADRVLQKTPFSFDVSVWEFFWPLISGARLILARPGGHQDSGYLVKLINEQQITTLHFVPSMLRVFLQEPGVESCKSLGRVICSGEALPFELQKRLFDRLDVALHNLYGPTEASIDVTFWECKPDSDQPIVPIGRPIANTQIYLLNSHLQPVPIGVAGELHIGGVGVGRGYHNRPDLTAEKFIPDPFSKDPQARLYKTGDLARYLPDGSIEYLGRMDFQVKIRGFRIELGEIEAALSQHPAVREAVVVAREDASGDKRLVTYVVTSQEEAGLITELRVSLANQLPEYMVPSAFVFLKALPLSANGKVDRRALPALDQARPELREAFVAPQTPVEEIVTQIWRDVLKLGKVGIHDNFFDLGGHSLTAIQVVLRIRETFRAELSLRSIFENPTVTGLTGCIKTARQIDHAQVEFVAPVPQSSTRPLSFAQQRLRFLEQIESGTGLYNIAAPFRINGPLDVPALEHSINEIARRHEALRTAFSTMDGVEAAPIPLDKELPLSFTQERFWFLSQLEPNHSAYNGLQTFRLIGSINVSALEKTFNEIVRRHEVLRTNFRVVDDQPVQIIREHRRFELGITNLTEHLPPQRDVEIRRLVDEEVQRPFDLSNDLMLRASLLKLAEKDHLLILGLHHIAFDHWSASILWQELCATYEAFSTGHPSPLPELSFQYKHFAVWQKQWFQGEVLEKQLSYWKRQLNGSLPPLQLPTDYPRPPAKMFSGERKSVLLPNTLTNALRTLNQTEGVTLFMTLLAAFKILLQRLSGQEDILVGTPVAGRNRTETEKLIGCFLNTLVLRTNLSGNPTFRQLLTSVREAALNAYDNQDLPFEKLLEELDIKRDLSRTPIFQVFFNMYNFEDTQFNLQELEVERLAITKPVSNFDLTLYVRERHNATHLSLVYNTDLFDERRVHEMLDQYQHLLTQIVEKPDKRISYFSLVTSTAEKLLPNPSELLHSDWAGAVHDRLSQQAKHRPEQVAVLDPYDSWTYQELNARSNQLAHYFLESGIHPDDIVAVYGHRSASLVWAVLGILKAGAAFLILDPAYPIARLIDYLRAARPCGFVKLEASGKLPDELESDIQQTVRCHVTLPRLSAFHRDEILRNYPTADPEVTIGPDDLAYVAYTSGSTGEPKGILGRHGPLSHFLPWQTEKFALGSSDRFSLLSGLSHDPLQREIFTALWVGATICIPDPDIIGAPGQLADWMACQKITFAHLTPPMGKLLTESAQPKCQLRPLRYALFVGDKLTRTDVTGLQDLAPRVTCVNYYGSTETQRAVSYYEIPPGHEFASAKGVIPVGRGMPDVQLLVLNAEQRLAGVGEVGEIYIRSPHLARGYLNDESLTQARFLPNPFTKEGTDRLYRTGDVGRYMLDGNVEILGRTDRQVKIRGFRVELGEIEAALAGHPDIREAVVLAREDKGGESYLAAYVVLKPGKAPKIHELHKHLKNKLPDYMIPTAVLTLDTFPLTPNGKIDTQALPVPNDTSTELKLTFVPPRTSVEEALARIWAEVLSTDKVGIRHNFFELGGHSLLAIRVMSRISQKFQMELPLRTLFEKPTIEDLAKLIAEKQTGRDGDESLTNLLADIELLSDEEARELAAQETKRRQRT